MPILFLIFLPNAAEIDIYIYILDFFEEEIIEIYSILLYIKSDLHKPWHPADYLQGKLGKSLYSGTFQQNNTNYKAGTFCSIWVCQAHFQIVKAC